MKESINHIEVNGVEYPLMVSINVIAWAQKKYGSIKHWQELMSPSDKELEGKIKSLQFRLEKAVKAHGENSKEVRELVSRIEELEEKLPEADLETIRDSFAEIINEGIDYENEIKSERRQLLTSRQVGRIVTAYGIQNASSTIMAVTVNSVASSEDDEKNG